MRVLRARTSCVTSLTILALSLGASVVNHLARRWYIQHGTYGIKGERDTHDFALPGEENEVPVMIRTSNRTLRAGATHLMAMVCMRGEMMVFRCCMLAESSAVGALPQPRDQRQACLSPQFTPRIAVLCEQHKHSFLRFWIDPVTKRSLRLRIVLTSHVIPDITNLPNLVNLA